MKATKRCKSRSNYPFLFLFLSRIRNGLTAENSNKNKSASCLELKISQKGGQLNNSNMYCTRVVIYEKFCLCIRRRNSTAILQYE